MSRLISYRVRGIALTLAFALAAGDARAQSVGLRGAADAGGDFPTSPSAGDLTTPERVTPPSMDASQVQPDEEVPINGSDQNPPDRGAPNYGKKRPTKPNLYKLTRKTNPRGLPPLVTYRRKITRRAQGEREEVTAARNGSVPPEDTTPPPTVAQIPRPIRQRLPVVESDPFAPIGVRAGEFLLRPSFEADTGYETNPNQVTTGVKPSIALRQEAGLDVQSDFSRSSLTASIRGGYSEFPQNTNANRPDANAVINGRLDVTSRDTINTEARFGLTTIQPGSPLLANPTAVFIVDRPLIVTEGATIGGAHDFGRFVASLRGTFDRVQYGDARESDGSTFKYSQDNYNDFGVVARAAYEITPGIIPFAEAGYDSRVRDNPVDLSGYYRDSIGGSGRAGATFDFVGHFIGSASAGYLERHYVDKRLQNLKGPTFDASLTYLATALTTFKIAANTVASETTLAGASGAISRTFTAEVDHALFSNFTLSGIATYQPNTYQGISGKETYLTFGLKGVYAVTRDVQLTATATHVQLNSTFIGDAFNDNIFLLGVKLQR